MAWAEIVAGIQAANAATVAAIKAHKNFAVMTALTAAGLIASLVLKLFGSPEVAVFAIIFVLGFMFVLLAFIAAQGRPSRPRRILADVLAWAFSTLMFAALVALFISYFTCWLVPIRNECRPIQRVQIDDFQLLSEKGVRREGPDTLIERILFNDDRPIDYAEHKNVAFPVVGSVSSYGVYPGGSIHLTITLWAGANSAKLENAGRVTIRSPNWWEDQRLVANLPGKKTTAEAALSARRFRIMHGGFPIFWMVGCFTEDQLKAGSTNVQMTVEDHVSGTFFSTDLLPVKFRVVPEAEKNNCPPKT